MENRWFFVLIGLWIWSFLASALRGDESDGAKTSKRPQDGGVTGGVTFAGYNLANYHIGSPSGGNRHTRPKSTESMQAAADIIAAASPDVLGVCEMGDRASLQDLQTRLGERGLHLTEIEFVEGPDSERHLALLSRFPLVARLSQPRIPFVLEGRPQLVRRGFLEVTIEPAPGYRLHLLGAHLKSRLAVSEGEETVRRFESHLLRERIDEILIQNPRENLLVYGDFNDTKDQACIQTILGLRGSPSALTDLPARDSVNDLWTHFWRAGDVYARIDYLLVSRGLLPEILPDRTRIDRSRHWNLASDHRLISTTLIPIEKKKP
jgi:endonuclease/exonuclease/phosphatase family metal-dependent hydrolase